MPATSEAQRRLFGMVLAMKRGKLKNASKEVQKVASGVTQQQASDFASKVEKKRSGIHKSLMK